MLSTYTDCPAFSFCSPCFGRTCLYAIPTIHTFFSVKDRLPFFIRDYCTLQTSLFTQRTSGTRIFLPMRVYHALKPQIHFRCSITIDRTSRKCHLKFMMTGSTEKLFVYFKCLFLGIHNPVRIILTTTTGGRDANSGTARCNWLPKFC